MNLDEMQKRLQALFVDKQNFDQQAEQFRQQSLMVQGHINELSFIIQSLATPAAQLEPVPELQEETQPEEQAA